MQNIDIVVISEFYIKCKFTMINNQTFKIADLEKIVGETSDDQISN